MSRMTVPPRDYTALARAVSRAMCLRHEVQVGAGHGPWARGASVRLAVPDVPSRPHTATFSTPTPARPLTPAPPQPTHPVRCVQLLSSAVAELPRPAIAPSVRLAMAVDCAAVRLPSGQAGHIRVLQLYYWRRPEYQ